jgi:NADP-dependent 3-hydroxy acid dehydrogenase YdfG
MPGGGAVEETPLDLFRQVMETNFFGDLRCIQTVVPSMRERRGGTIVNVTTIAGRMASAAMASYAASKWALEALSERVPRPGNARLRAEIFRPSIGSSNSCAGSTAITVSQKLYQLCTFNSAWGAAGAPSLPCCA